MGVEIPTKSNSCCASVISIMTATDKQQAARVVVIVMLIVVDRVPDVFKDLDLRATSDVAWRGTKVQFSHVNNLSSFTPLLLVGYSFDCCRYRPQGAFCLNERLINIG